MARVFDGFLGRASERVDAQTVSEASRVWTVASDYTANQQTWVLHSDFIRAQGTEEQKSRL